MHGRFVVLCAELCALGLWPENKDGTWPEHCSTDTTYDPALAMGLKDKVSKKWPSFYGTDPQVWTHGWKNHGHSCTLLNSLHPFHTRTNYPYLFSRLMEPSHAATPRPHHRLQTQYKFPPPNPQFNNQPSLASNSLPPLTTSLIKFAH